MRCREGQENQTRRLLSPAALPIEHADDVSSSKLEAAAAESGRSLAQEAEALIERALQLDKVLAAMHTTLADFERGNIDAALRRAGYVIVDRDPDTNLKLWAEPGFPNTEHLRSGFVAPTPEEDQ